MIKYEMIAITKPENGENALDSVIDIIKKQNVKITKMWKVNNRLLNNQWIIDEIK